MIWSMRKDGERCFAINILQRYYTGVWLYPDSGRIFQYLAAVRSANQLLSALVLITLCVFLKVTGRELRTLIPPFVIMLIVTFTALVQRFISLVKAFADGTGVFMVEGLQLIVAVLLMILGVTIVVTSGKELLKRKCRNHHPYRLKGETGRNHHDKMIPIFFYWNDI